MHANTGVIKLNLLKSSDICLSEVFKNSLQFKKKSNRIVSEKQITNYKQEAQLMRTNPRHV